MNIPEPIWESRLRAIVTVNGDNPYDLWLSMSWVRPECCDGEAVGDLMRLLVERFYQNGQSFPLHVDILVEKLPGHGTEISYERVERTP